MIHSRPNTQEKLSILSEDAQYDLACACGTGADDRRHRSGNNDRWIYPVTLPNGGKSVLFKTLMSNVCSSDCRYCPLRADRDPRRCTLQPEEVVRAFMGYLRAGKVFGMFLSSGVIGTPDATMERLNSVVRILRTKEKFRGFVHLKIIPGASDEAICEAVSLSSNVSLNIETAGEKHFRHLSSKKDYLTDIIRPLKLIRDLTASGARYSRVNPTTQFVVGASDETDSELVKYSGAMYQRLGIKRIYFSAYQRGLGSSELPGEKSPSSGDAILTREHRLYQTDFLMRRYGFDASEIPFDGSGNLRLDMDPKEYWAHLHPEFFPVRVNTARKSDLLRVPGLGHVTVGNIIKRRKAGKLKSIYDIGRVGRLLLKAEEYLDF